MKRQKKRPASEHAEPPALFASAPSVDAGGQAMKSRGLLEFLPPTARRGWLCGLLIVVLAMLAYGPVWRAGFIWDDDRYVTENPLLTASDGLWRIWFSRDSPSQYFPLTYTTFYLERGLWGLDPTGYHVVNLLLHAANALLVWRVLARLGVPASWLAAAVFALHPVQVESVAWITERKNVLMGFFFLLTLWAWLKFIEGLSKRPWRFYLLALVFYALALFAKTTACTLPAALLLILWLKKMPVNWRRLAQVAPFLAMGIAMGWVTVWWERFHQLTQGEYFQIGWVERVLMASRALWFYAGKLLWPADLVFSYPRWTISPSDPRAYVWVLATAVLAVAIWRARRWTGRSVEAAVVYFTATLSPVLGFFMIYTFLYSFVADHYQYLACIGPIALAAAGLEIGLGRFGAGRSFLEPLCCAALLMTLGALTWRQCGMYADSKTLWETTLARNPNSWLAQGDLGNALLKDGQVDEAIAHFQKALEINPNFAATRYNLGLALSLAGRTAQAITQYEKAVELKPDYAEAHNNLGLAFYRLGKLDEAIPHFQKAVELKPDYAEAHNNLGLAFYRLGKLDEAIPHFQKAVELKPDYAEAHNNLGLVFYQLGKLDEAFSHCQKAVELKPDLVEAQNNLGNVFYQQGRMDQAILQYRKTLELQPDHAQAQKNLAWVLATCPQAALRNGPQAVELAERANQMAGGGNPFFLCTLAAAYAEAGRFSEAVETAQHALHSAGAQSNTPFAAQLQSQLKLYQAGLPYHSPEPSSASSRSK
jgi:tetratricopeptide (TPR) repeat protein